jgi:hypothetical protein
MASNARLCSLGKFRTDGTLSASHASLHGLVDALEHAQSETRACGMWRLSGHRAMNLADVAM